MTSIAPLSTNAYQWQQTDLETASTQPAEKRAQANELNVHVAQTAAEANIQKPPGIVSFANNKRFAEQSVQYANNQDVTFVLGLTGSGKSTFINYMTGMKFKYGSTTAWSNVKCIEDESAEVGHTHSSCTTKPEMIFHGGLTFCDCPGFCDNRGIDSDIANIISISHAAKICQNIRGIILCVEYDAFRALRGSLISETIQRVQHFLGQNMKLNVFLLITKAADKINDIPDRVIEELLEIAKTSNHCEILSDLINIGNIGFYSPMEDFKDQSPYIYTRETMEAKLKSFTPIPHLNENFQIPLNQEAVNYISHLLNEAIQTIDPYINQGQFESLFKVTESVSALRTLAQGDQFLTKKKEEFESALLLRIQLMAATGQDESRLNIVLKLFPQFKEIIDNAISRIKARQALELERKEKDETLKNLQKQNSELSERISELREKWFSLKSVNQANEMKLEQLNGRVKSLQEENTKTITKTKEEFNQLLSAEKASHQKTSEELRHLHQQKNDLSKRIATINNEFSILKSSSQQELQKLKNQIQSLQAENAKTKENETKCQQLFFYEQTEHNSARQQLQHTSQQNCELTNRISMIGNELSALKSNNQCESRQLYGQIQSLQAENAKTKENDRNLRQLLSNEQTNHQNTRQQLEEALRRNRPPSPLFVPINQAFQSFGRHYPHMADPKLPKFWA